MSGFEKDEEEQEAELETAAVAINWGKTTVFLNAGVFNTKQKPTVK